jgi:hypothetical protein
MQRNKKTKVLHRYHKADKPLPEYPYKRYSLEEFLAMGWNDLSFRVELMSIWFRATYRAHGVVNLAAEHNLKTWQQAEVLLRSEEVQRIRGR